MISAQPAESVEAGDTREPVIRQEKHSEKDEKGLRLPPEPPQSSCPLSSSHGELPPLPRGERNRCFRRRGLPFPDVCVPDTHTPIHDQLSTVSSPSSVREELDDSMATERSHSLVSQSCTSGRGWGEGCMVGGRVRDPPRQGHQCGEYKGDARATVYSVSTCTRFQYSSRRGKTMQ